MIKFTPKMRQNTFGGRNERRGGEGREGMEMAGRGGLASSEQGHQSSCFIQ